MGWGRRCGLGASNSARQPPPMAEAARLWSGCGPARRASHARHPGGAGLRPGGTTAAPRGARRTVTGAEPVPEARTGRRGGGLAFAANAANGAPRGERPSPRTRTPQAASLAPASKAVACMVAPLGAPFPSFFRGDPKAPPGRRSFRRAGNALDKDSIGAGLASYLAPRVCSRSAIAQRCSGSRP